MNIDELKETRDTFAVWGYETLLSDELIEKIISILDAEIARQSVTDEDVQDALWHFNLTLNARKEQEEETRKHYGGELPSFEVAVNKYETLAITALQQMRTEGCHCCNSIENHDIKSVKTVTDKQGRELDAYNTPYNYCPNCGRKVR